MMIKHYLKVAFRNLLKYKMQSLISIIGLAIGFACFALSALWIRYEITYDNFHEGADRIFLAGSDTKSGDGFSYYSSSLLADYLVKNYPEIEKSCHIKSNDTKVKYKDREYPMKLLDVDSCFISLFNIDVIDGDNRLKLDEDQIAITDKAAKRIFGDESPIGKQLSFTQWGDVGKTIVAVVESWKGHSLYPFDILLPYYDRKSRWGDQQSHTFFSVYPNTDVKALEKKLAEYIVPEDSYTMTIYTPIALLSTLRSTHPRLDINVKLNHVCLFACIGALVIICGLCNYLTMLVTRIRMRKRELALRKVNGASNASLLSLILIELLLLLLISSGIGIMLIELILPVFKRISQIDESTSYFYHEVFMYMFLLLLIATVSATILVYFVNKQTLLESIRYKSSLHLSGWFYKGSILFQLIIGIGFVFCTLVMMKQLNYLLNSRELGLERHNVGAFYQDGFEDVPFKKILNQMPDVTEWLNDFYTPIPKGRFYIREVSEWEGQTDKKQKIEIESETINQNYVDFFHIEVIEGTMLDEKDGNESVVINESAAKAFGWNQSVGKKIQIDSFNEYVVKGVIKDIYYNAPIYPVSPTVFFLPKRKDRGDYIFKFKEGTWQTVSQKLREEVYKFNPNEELYLINMEDEYDEYMKSEETLNKLLGGVSIICIIIAIFGIFSLVTLSCQQRCKEIAIRKVNGASVRVILNLFFKEYVYLLVAASCIAFPLGYVIMKYWLEGYVKQTPVSIWIYGGIFVGMLFIIFLSIGWRVWEAARQNPAEVIKSE